MAKTKEITFICESAGVFSTYENKVKITADVTNADLSALISSISEDDLFNLIDDDVFERWAEKNGFVKETSVK
jgi:hypothetical protein